MSYKTDLEARIRESYKLINEYEEIKQLSNDPREIGRAKKAIVEQWEYIKSFLNNYISLCNRLQLNKAEDITEIIAILPLDDSVKSSQLFTVPALRSTSVPTSRSSKGFEVFFSYAREDEYLRNELAKQLSLLKREGWINDWYDHRITPGEDWAVEIDRHLNTARIILLLVSADFIASDYCYGIEMKRAMERQESGEAKVIPIILRPVDWHSAPFGKLLVLPEDGKAITTWGNIDSAFLDVARGIRQVIEELNI